MNHCANRMPIAGVAVLFAMTALALADPAPAFDAHAAAVAALFEDDAAGLLKLLTNAGDGPGNGEPESQVVFSGSRSIRISSYQRFCRRLPGWNFAIREHPRPGEYRYLRFAWKADGCQNLMLQLHDATDWHLRYRAGADVFGWLSQVVGDQPPAHWRLVTVDLFRDFGERTLTGLALTIHGGAGYFDHIYLGRTIDDLDRIDITSSQPAPRAFSVEEAESQWRDLAHDDDAVQYRAFWALVHARDPSAAFLRQRLSPPELNEVDRRCLESCIADLDSTDYARRAAASAALKSRIETALPLVEAELARSASPEARHRLARLLSAAPDRDRELQRRAKAQKILALIAS